MGVTNTYMHANTHRNARTHAHRRDKGTRVTQERLKFVWNGAGDQSRLRVIYIVNGDQDQLSKKYFSVDSLCVGLWIHFTHTLTLTHTDTLTLTHRYMCMHV